MIAGEVSMRLRKFPLLPGCLSGCLFALAGVSSPAWAQTNTQNEWIWMGGDTTVANDGFQPGVYGTLGVPAAGNIPMGRYGAARWTDSSGHFWLFGGELSAPNGDPGGYYSYTYLNDLWEFDPATNQWTWMGGSSTLSSNCVELAGPSGQPYCGQSGVYGTLGTPAAGNLPGSREAAATWTGTDGSLWLFGGDGFDAAGNYGFLNDLWVFTPSSNQWTWMGGSSTLSKSGEPLVGEPGIYGTLGTPSPEYHPGGRNGAASWTDSGGNFWLFGGDAVDAEDYIGYLDDLWQFNPSTHEWAWMSGSSSIFLTAEFGTLGTFAPGNLPPGLQNVSSWVDSSGDFWLFGGYGEIFGAEFGALGPVNGLWEFDPARNEWAWMGGANTLLNGMTYWPGVYGTLGTPAAANIPGSRFGATSWTDSKGNLWLFGGNGADASGFPDVGFLDDLWELNPATDEWTWMGGSGTTLDASGVYGTLGVPAPANIPGGRFFSSTWTDQSGNIWLFGGWGMDSQGNFGYLNDLWEYSSSAAPVLPQADTPVFNSSNPPPTLALTVTIGDATPRATIYYTTSGTTPTTSSTVYTGPITVSSNETLEAIATASGYSMSAVATATYSQTAAPTFSPAGGTYASTQSVTVSDSTPGAAIFCSFANSTPPPGPGNCDGPLVVSQSSTVNAYAVASGYALSAVASATYTIPSDFLLAIDPTSLTVQAGQSGTGTITVTDEGGFNGNVSFACSGLPAGAACSFALEIVPTPTGITYTTLTVTTSKSTALMRRDPAPLIPAAALAAFLCCFGFKRRRWHMFLLLTVSAFGLGALNGCNASLIAIAQPDRQTTSTVTVTATSGALQHSTTFSLTVN
jgi:N-acetylneuraminic acid mutarotase